MAAALLQVFVAGLYSSAEASVIAVPVVLVPSCPPTTRTLPSGNSVAVWSLRGVDIAPALLQVLLIGLYNSAVAKAVSTLSPPTTRTVPLARTVSVWESRTVAMLPALVQAPVMDG